MPDLESRHLSEFKCNECVELGEKLASVCLESSGTAYRITSSVYVAIKGMPIDRVHNVNFCGWSTLPFRRFNFHECVCHVHYVLYNRAYRVYANRMQAKNIRTIFC